MFFRADSKKVSFFVGKITENFEKNKKKSVKLPLGKITEKNYFFLFFFYFFLFFSNLLNLLLYCVEQA